MISGWVGVPMIRRLCPSRCLLRDHVDLLYERAGRVDRHCAAGRQRPLLSDGDSVRADDNGLAGLRLVCR